MSATHCLILDSALSPLDSSDSLSQSSHLAFANLVRKKSLIEFSYQKTLINVSSLYFLSQLSVYLLRDTQVTEPKNAIKLTEDLDSEYNGLYSMIKREREKYGAGRKAVAGCLLEA
jgi:hypothetical protein